MWSFVGVEIAPKFGVYVETIGQVKERHTFVICHPQFLGFGGYLENVPEKGLRIADVAGVSFLNTFENFFFGKSVGDTFFDFLDGGHKVVTMSINAEPVWLMYGPSWTPTDPAG